MASKVLVINGSLGGASGNTTKCLAPLLAKFHSLNVQMETIYLSEGFELQSIEKSLRAADAFVFVSGTYWDSWGSPLQKFFEETTELETGDVWLGKPAACFISMHSVGGKEVLSRLQGVLSTLGLMIPPMSGMTYSFANHQALITNDNADLWRLTDLEILAENLILATKLPRVPWKTWPVDNGDAMKVWL